MLTVEKVKQMIMEDEANQLFTEQGIAPLFAAPPTARINIIGQAPGRKTQEAGLYWSDQSGERLREWLGVDREMFYQSGLFAALPMDFYFPGSGKSGDLPPRVDFAAKWHPLLLGLMPQIELNIVIGQYAQRYYLQHKRKATLTETVRCYQEYLPEFFPLVHPSPRNQIWLKRNTWFTEEVVPDLQRHVQKILK